MCILRKIKSWFKKETPTSKPTTIRPMDIEEVVESSIIGIISGIQNTQKKFQTNSSSYGPLISPASVPSTSDLQGEMKGCADKLYDIDFDLAVTCNKSSSGNFEVKVVGLGGLGLSGETKRGQSIVNRIRFKIPIRYPLAKVNKPD